jgi:hypothetical protein
MVYVNKESNWLELTGYTATTGRTCRGAVDRLLY